MEIYHKIGISKWRIWKKRKRLKVCNFKPVRLPQLYPQETTKNKNAQNMKKRMQKCESVKMQNYENLKTQKLKSSPSPVSPGDDSGELVAAHEWTWQVGFNKNNRQFKNTHFPFICFEYVYI